MAKKSNSKKPQENKAEEILEVEETVEQTEEVAAPVEEIVEEKPEPVEEPPKNSPIRKGIVANTKMLNMRKHADKSSSIVCVLDKDSSFTVNLDKSNKDWYSVRTDDGRYGYCMREFVDLSE